MENIVAEVFNIKSSEFMKSSNFIGTILWLFKKWTS